MSDTLTLDDLLDEEPLPEIKHSATVKQIRDWANENGWNISPKGRVNAEVRAAYNLAHGVEDQPRSQEIAPKYEAQTAKTKVKGFFSGSRSKSPKSRKQKPRVSIADIVTTGWWALSKAAEPISSPMAKMLAIEAPVAGMMLDESLKGTLVDRVLQPIARAEESGKVVAALLMPPLLVGAIDKNPNMAGNLLPLLRKSLAWHIETAGPKIAEKMAKEAEFEAQYGQDIDAMIRMVFGVEEEEDANYAE